MVRPSQVARKAAREHERQQESLRKRNLRTCQGCDLCSATKARNLRKVVTDSHMNQGSSNRNQVQRVCSKAAMGTAAQNTPCSPRQASEPSPRCKIRQSLENIRFRGIVIINPRHVALDIAAKEVVSACAGRDRLVYWTDCSRMKHSHCGIGIAYYSPTEAWTQLSWHIQRCVRTHALEAYAIAKALELAWEHCRNVEAEQRPRNVVIYSDCPAALECFARLQLTLDELGRLADGDELVGPGMIATEELSNLKVEVELRYVPGHAGIEGNLRADRAARSGAKHSVGRQEAARLMTECGGRGKVGI